MELPIDHFRLLGVNSSSDAQSVLRTLDLRLDRVPDEGFSRDTLLARAELLRESADLLSDTVRRGAYEATLTALIGGPDPVIPALDIPSNKELGGLLLLLEAHQPLECLELTRRCLQPPQAPTISSAREADLALLAGLSCLEAAEDLGNQRRYEAAAATLEEGLQLLQRMGQHPALRERMNRRLEALSPYRILDLLSRDLSAVSERRHGLELLEELVQRRGGLEGPGDPSLGPREFETFLTQIRTYLTVQEQVDLFSRWGDAGSTAADALATRALAASGFAQRKPERIAVARDRFERRSNQADGAVLANLHLLLGEVEKAEELFETQPQTSPAGRGGAGDDDLLARLCAQCHRWLEREVLPGYRDLESRADLEAYFGDHDVQAYVEGEDQRSGRSYAPSPAPVAAPTSPSLDFGSSTLSSDFDWDRLGLGLGLGQEPGDRPGGTAIPMSRDEGDEEDEDVSLGWSLPRLGDLPALAGLQGMGRRMKGPGLAAAAASVAALLLLGFWLLRPRQPAQPRSEASPPVPDLVQGEAPPAPETPQPASPRTPGAAPSSNAAGPDQPPPPATVAPSAAAPSATSPAAPLNSADPTPAQLQALLEAWLAGKARVLAGGTPPENLGAMARQPLLASLQAERSQDAARRQTRNVETEIRSVAIESRGPNRIEARVSLDYSDTVTEADGKQRRLSANTRLNNLYIFGRDGETWRLAAFRPVP